MKINKALPFAIIYYFFNSLGLPFGLTYTTLLAPLFYWYIITKRQKDVYLPFLFVFIIFYLVQSHFGVNDIAYLVSFMNMSGVYIFCQAFYTWLQQKKDPEPIFTWLIRTNFILCLLAIPIYFTPFQDTLWITQFLTNGFDNFRRLKMFTYEASYYANLTIPLFFYFLLQLAFNQQKINRLLLLCMITLPYILSFALGVMAGIVISLAIVYFVYFQRLTKKKIIFNAVLTAGCVGTVLFLVALLFFPDNPLFVRIGNVLSDNDSSGRGRTYEAFQLVSLILEKRNVYWGIGPGQMKFIGAEMIRDFYLYPLDLTGMAIPNTTAETLVVFGYIGLSIRLIAEVYFFFRTRVWKNYFQLLLFSFIFIYQFTGSFVTNVAEYVIWILAFTNFFPQFNVQPAGIKDRIETATTT